MNKTRRKAAAPCHRGNATLLLLREFTLPSSQEHQAQLLKVSHRREDTQRQRSRVDLQLEARGGLSTDSLAESPDREKLDPRPNHLQSILDAPPDKTAVRHPGTKDTTKKTLARDLFTGPRKNPQKKSAAANAPFPSWLSLQHTQPEAPWPCAASTFTHQAAKDIQGGRAGTFSQEKAQTPSSKGFK